MLVHLTVRAGLYNVLLGHQVWEKVTMTPIIYIFLKYSATQTLY